MKRLYEFDTEAIRKGIEIMKDDCNKLIELGWTIPLDVTPRELNEMLRARKSSSADEVFMNYYHKNNQSNFERLKKYLLNNKEIENWRPLLKDCFDVYELDKYFVVIPALITIIDGLIASAGNLKGTRILGYLKERLESSISDSITNIIWKSIYEFIKLLFQKNNFDAERPLFINRHWILHGRDIVDWNKADALKLFNALYTIINMITKLKVKHYRVEKKYQPSREG